MMHFLKKGSFKILLVILIISGCFAFSQEIPNPEKFFGFQPGADYHLLKYKQMYDYFNKLGELSPKLQVFEMGKTEMGESQIGAIITSPQNMQQLDRFKSIARQLALAKDLNDEAAKKLASEGRAVVYIDGGLHAAECGPPQAGTPYETSSMPWVYNKYVGHDNNRDSFMNNMKETRNITKLVSQDWHPQILLNHHQTAPFPARIWVPPHSEPSNPNIHPLMFRWQNLLGTAMGLRHESQGQDGVISRNGFDSWYPGYVTHSMDSRNVISLLTEVALYRYATPKKYTIDDFPEEYKDLKNGVFYPNPWKGGWWRLRDAVDYTITSSKAVLHTAAVYRKKLLYDRYQMGRDVIKRFESEPPYAWIVPKEQRDNPTAALMLNKLGLLGIDVYKADSDFQYLGINYPAGTWILPMNQAFALHLKALFEIQHYPDMLDYPNLWQGTAGPQKLEGAYFGPQDTCGWTLPQQMGVDVIEVKDKPLNVGISLAQQIKPDQGSAPISTPGYAYMLNPQLNNTFIAMNRIQKNGGKLIWARESFKAGGEHYIPGTVIVPASSVKPDLMKSLADDLSLKIKGTDGKAEIETFALNTPRIALYKSWTASMDEGWTRWLFEQYEFPFKNVFDADIKAGNIKAKFDVLVIPDMNTQSIVNGHKKGTISDKYAGGITEKGVENIKTFIKQGGTVVLINGGSNFALDKLGVPIKNALQGVKQYGGRRGPSGTPEFVCPGSLLKVEFDPTHPVCYGMKEEAAAYFSRSCVFDASSAVVVAGRYPERDLLISGYLKGEEYMRHKAVVVEARQGKGKIILLGFSVQNRAQPHNTFRLLFNSLFYGVTATP